MKIQTVVGAALVLAALAVAVAAGFVREYSGDFHWHAVQGEWTLRHLAIYQRDVHSATFAGQPMFNSAWLGDVVLALAFRGGYVGLYLLRSALLVTLSLLLMTESRRIGAPLWVAALLVLVVLTNRFSAFYVRPDTFAFVLLGWMLFLLGQHERTSRPLYLWATLGIILLWANLHASVGIGLLSVGLHCAHMVLVEWFGKRRWRVLALPLAIPPAAFLVACINPEGLGLPLAFRVMREAWISRIYEWLPLHLKDITPYGQMTWLAILLSSGAVLALRRRVSWWRLALFAILAYFSFRYRRFTPYALIAAVPLVASNLATLRQHFSSAELPGRQKLMLRGLAVVVAGIVIPWSAAMLFVDNHLIDEVGTGIDTKAGSYPIKAVVFARKHGLRGPVLNDYDMGSYLMHAMPEARVYIDQRAWSLYSEDHFNTYYRMALSLRVVLTAAERYRLNWALQRYSPLARQLSANRKHWRLIYFDDKALIYLRNVEANATLIAQEGFLLLDPIWVARLPDVRPKHHSALRLELARQKARCPNCYRTLLAEAGVAVASRDGAAFRQAARAIIRRYGNTAVLSRFAARLAGQPQK